MSGPKRGITKDRKTPDKIDFIIKNYENMTRQELADNISESLRWVKRQISLLTKSGKIKSKRGPIKPSLSFEDWPDGALNTAADYRFNWLKTDEEISELILSEYGFNVCAFTVGYWLRKINCRARTKREWLDEFLPEDKAIELLDKSFRMKDISEYLEDEYSVYVSDDLILEHIQKLGLRSLRLKKIYDINTKAESYSKEWYIEQLNSRKSLSQISREMNVSITVLRKLLKRRKIELPDKRIVWSKDLDDLRDSLINLNPAPDNIPESDIHQMILGWLLGDGSLDSYGRFVTNHALSQTSYLSLKCRVLKRYITSIVTVPAKTSQKNNKYIEATEQLGISCPGLDKYLIYLNKDGTKNHEKIMSELNPLGWACYFMDDGAHSSGNAVMTMSSKISCKFENRFIFNRKTSTGLYVGGNIDPRYIIPSMAYKLDGYEKVGEYWKSYFSEFFNPEINTDLDLSLVNSAICRDNESILNRCVEYYHKRGFPTAKYEDDYLYRQMEDLRTLNTKHLWRSSYTLRKVPVGNRIFTHFMDHLYEAKYRGQSPKDIFNGYTTLRSVLEYSIKKNKSILPSELRNNMLFFNGGVSGFPCGIAKALVEKYSFKGDVIVDPCAGWGGRLLGTVSADNREYHAFEPWAKTYDKLIQMVDFFSIDNCHIYNMDFNPNKGPDRCRLIMTSPPYVDLEVYGKPFTMVHWKMLIRFIFQYAERNLIENGRLLLNIPKYLYTLLPETKLTRDHSVYWFNSTRQKSLDKAEIVYIWKK